MLASPLLTLSIGINVTGEKELDVRALYMERLREVVESTLCARPQLASVSEGALETPRRFYFLHCIVSAYDSH